MFLSELTFESPVEILEIEAGEESKDIEIASGLWLSLNELNADRRSLLINLGGGVVSDLGSWVAANYKRGIDFITIPTSLLAMVDASIGGKTGIDLGGIKNLIGSFSLPERIVIFPDFLDSLDEDEWISGFAEMIKHSLISSKGSWDSLKVISMGDKALIKSLIKESADVKINIVDEDYYEKGERKKLNLGHTIGHAIESLSIERNEIISHGHAVAIGIVLEAVISYQSGLLSKDQLEDISLHIFKLYSLPTWLNEALPEMILKMKKDKKNNGESINMVLLEEIGKASYDHAIEEEMIIRSVEYIYSLPTNE